LPQISTVGRARNPAASVVLCEVTLLFHHRRNRCKWSAGENAPSKTKGKPAPHQHSQGTTDTAEGSNPGPKLQARHEVTVNFTTDRTHSEPQAISPRAVTTVYHWPGNGRSQSVVHLEDLHLLALRLTK